jgi:hypothetical protein
LTIEEYVALYGAIDNVTVIFSAPSAPFSAPHGGMIPFVPESPTFDHELLWYEFHLFNTLPYITDVEVTNAGTLWNVPQPWGLSADRVSGGEYIITVNVPKTADFGSYFLTVTDNSDNEESTILVVTQDINSIWIWIFPLVMFLLTVGLWGYADHVNDSGKNPSAVVLLIAGGVFTLGIGLLMVLDITGYWATGIVPMGLIFGAVALGSGDVRSSIKRHKRTIKKVFTGLIMISMIFGFSALAVTSIATYTVSPASITASPGEKITVNFYSDDAEITKNDTSISIVKTDEETPYSVYWTYTKNVADDKLSGSFVITIPAKAATGVYTITIREGEIWSKSVSLYVPEDAGLNWMILMSLILVGGLFLGALALGWAHVKRTPTFADNAGLIAVGFAGAMMWLLAALYYLGYWTI